MSVLRDLLAPGLAVVFCGTAAGTVSARRLAYYAGPGNAFWPTLFEVGFTPCCVEPEKYELIQQYGLGLTDLAKMISGSDRVLSTEHFDRDGLRAKIRRFCPRVLAFTSKRAAEEFLGHWHASLPRGREQSLSSLQMHRIADLRNLHPKHTPIPIAVLRPFKRQ